MDLKEFHYEDFSDYRSFPHVTTICTISWMYSTDLFIDDDDAKMHKLVFFVIQKQLMHERRVTCLLAVLRSDRSNIACTHVYQKSMAL
jgi:hypothetical protein